MTNEVITVDPYLDRTSAAADISEHLFPVTPRALREWTDPVTITISGRACAPRSEWRAEAKRRLNEALFHGGDGRVQRRDKMARARAALTQNSDRAA